MNETRVLNKNPSTPALEKKPSSKTIITNNYLSENQKSDIKRACICYSNYDESYIKNGICRFCSRNVDTISHDQSLKKKYQEQASLNLRPR
jgi:hypothetical protein